MIFPAEILQDWNCNRGSIKGRMLLVMYRTARGVYIRPITRILIGWFVVPVYRLFTEWLLNAEIPVTVPIGAGLRLFHAHALVIHPQSVIGRECTLRHSTTLGARREGGKGPVVGDSVDIGAQAMVLCARVGDGAVIGAGSVVLDDVPAMAVVVGNPARIAKYMSSNGAV